METSLKRVLQVSHAKNLQKPIWKQISLDFTGGVDLEVGQANFCGLGQPPVGYFRVSRLARLSLPSFLRDFSNVLLRQWTSEMLDVYNLLVVSKIILRHF